MFPAVAGREARSVCRDSSRSIGRRSFRVNGGTAALTNAECRQRERAFRITSSGSSVRAYDPIPLATVVPTVTGYILSVILAVVPMLPQARFDCRMSGRQAMTVCCCAEGGCCADDWGVGVGGEDEQTSPCCAGNCRDASSHAPCSPQPDPDDEDEGTADAFVPTDCQCCDVRLASSSITAVADSKPTTQATERSIVHLLAIPPPPTHDLVVFHDAIKFSSLFVRMAGCPPERPLYLRHCALLI